MAQRMRFSLQKTMSQCLSPSMQLSLQILQLSELELEQLIQAEIELNPLLEPIPAVHKEIIEFPDRAAKSTLREHLLSQARDQCKGEQLNIALWIIDQLDERGWYTEPIESDEMLQVLRIVQTFDPPGIGARNLQETLLLQLPKDSPARPLLELHFSDLLLQRFARIQKKLRLSAKEFQTMIRSLSTLSTRPAASFDDVLSAPLRPDLIVQEAGDSWSIELPEEHRPSFRIQNDYLHLSSTLQQSEKKTVRSWMARANWLCRSIQRRSETLKSIGKLLLKTQLPFFRGEGGIEPIKIQTLAAQLQVHETTARRAVDQKTLCCPQGLIALKTFFSCSSQTTDAKERLKQLIAQEDKQKPFTDEELVCQLKEYGLDLSRRTVAKYRSALRLLPAASRSLLCSKHRVDHVPPG